MKFFVFKLLKFFNEFILFFSDFSLLFPQDAPSNPSLDSPREILLSSFVHDEDLIELDNETCLALETLFDFSLLTPETSFNSNNEVSKTSLKSDELFSGSLSSLEEILFKDLMENHWKSDPENESHEETQKASAYDEEDLFIVVDDIPKVRQDPQENFSTPCQIEDPVEFPEIKPPTPFKRKQDLSLFKHSSISFDSNTPIAHHVKSRVTPRLKLVSYQDAYVKTVPPKKVETALTRCGGCEKMFKKITLHKCKGIVKTNSDPLPSPTSSSKFNCKFCNRSFRSENLFHNHLNSHLEVSPVTRPIHPSLKRRI